LSAMLSIPIPVLATILRFGVEPSAFGETLAYAVRIASG